MGFEYQILVYGQLALTAVMTLALVSIAISLKNKSKKEK